MDIETGKVCVLRVVAAHDCGRVINPLLVESQVMASVAAVLRLSPEGKVGHARLVVGGVAPSPWRARAAELRCADERGVG